MRACGVRDVGSIPTGGTKKILNLLRIFCFKKLSTGFPKNLTFPRKNASCTKIIKRVKYKLPNKLNSKFEYRNPKQKFKI